MKDQVLINAIDGVITINRLGNRIDKPSWLMSVPTV